MYTIAVPCDGKIECKDAADESWLCTDQNILIYTVLGKIISCPPTLTPYLWNFDHEEFPFISTLINSETRYG